MYKLLKVVFITLYFGVVIFSGCKKNKPPDIPSTPSGPTSGSINTDYTFFSSAEDPNGDSVAIRFDWGDGDTSSWSSWKAGGDSVSMFHSWSDIGTYSIKAQAKDFKEITSPWSRGHQLIIGNPPHTPSVPDGPLDAGRNIAYNFSSTAEDPDEDSVAIRFNWGDGDTSDWSLWKASGDSISMFHSWSDIGTYSIKAQAKDIKNLTSDWSESHNINISITFVKTFGGTDYDYGYSVYQTLDGGYIITGSTGSFGADGSDVYIIKTDENGNQQWYKTFGESNIDLGYSVKQTLDGGYIIAGYTLPFTFNVYLIKTDASGNQIWYKTFGGTGHDNGYSVQQTSDSGYIIVGFTSSYGSSGDVYLIKTNVDGIQTWYKTFGGSNSDCGNSVQQTHDGDYIIAGYTESYGAGGSDVYLIKTDANGNKQWDKTFGGVNGDIGYSVQQTKDGGYIITGSTDSYGAGADDVYLIKTDANGNTIWTKTFGGPDDDGGYSVQQTSDGGYIIAGYTKSFGAGNYDVYLIKTDGNGNQQWYKAIGGTDSDWGYSVQQTTDYSYIIAGYTYSYGAGASDVYLIKTDANGNVE